MKITTWNVNSINVRLTHLLSFLETEKPDVIGLQELKAPNDKFPLAEIEATGYHVVLNGQPTYNGVALIASQPIDDVVLDIPGFDSEEKRVITGTVAGVRIVNAYVPNGQNPDSNKYEYKLRWLTAFTDYLEQLLEEYPQLIVIGDFNIAPTDDDVHNPASWKGKILCTDQERAAFQGLLDLGFLDTLRIEAKPKGTFTWWDYRQGGFEKNSGIRIDHLLSSKVLGRRYQASMVHLDYRALERPSDHAPVSAVFK
ncbi:exodeoxyribonuclease III [Ignatzschineria ureiclastica]|uniref:Exodeoxyribonuclease III n=1 Tax=Ignatzschineria ureiclastica TaxID=472582 RepID=A0A2U2AD74_9GAMM|nr:exodeoxyribonuclease III [Ignatzschineria ureiclastica]PWD80603.1 exodeoxyribonuclease III [Ignatzschineria ureiclastica]GHA02286.1 exodeoxyribonuclease III [Ignatzschineria ureiclastica]